LPLRPGQTTELRASKEKQHCGLFLEQAQEETETVTVGRSQNAKRLLDSVGNTQANCAGFGEGLR
jgi:hypothetical protein